VPFRLIVLAVVVLALAGCRIQRTPPEYLDQRDPGEVDRQEAANEIRARVGAFRQALTRGDRGTAAAALSPVGLSHVIGLDAHGGLPRYGPGGLAAALDELEIPSVSVARTPDLRVEVSLRQGVGWFATHVELFPVGGDGEPQSFRMTGVMARDRGEWRLAQVHFSRGLALADAEDAPTTPPARDGAPPAGE
jgi:hypothetical protein